MPGVKSLTERKECRVPSAECRVHDPLEGSGQKAEEVVVADRFHLRELLYNTHEARSIPTCDLSMGGEALRGTLTTTSTMRPGQSAREGKVPSQSGGLGYDDLRDESRCDETSGMRAIFQT